MNFTLPPLSSWPLVIAFISCSVTGSLCLRVAGTRNGWQAVAIFIAGNASGFLAATCLTFALRGRQPNLIYALCLGGGFCTLQLAAWMLFRVPLTAWQWFGISLIAAGIICLQIRQ